MTNVQQLIRKKGVYCGARMIEGNVTAWRAIVRHNRDGLRKGRMDSDSVPSKSTQVYCNKG